MSGAREEPLYIPGDSGRLSGVLYSPDGASSGSVLFCNPLFEERKSSQRVMVDCARALCADGFTVLRFDYSGCGDSDGAFEDYSPDHWVADIKKAAGVLSDRAGTPCSGFVALRAGANLALRAIEEGTSADFLAIWEGIPDGVGYIEHELRRKVLREMVTFGKGRGSRQSAEESLRAGETVDLDGYGLSPALFDSLREMNLESALARVKVPVFFAHVTHGDAPTAALAPLRDLLVGRGETFELLKEEPFWNRIGVVKCRGLIQMTREWIGSRTS